MRKLAVVFPGIGYTVDKPLLYFSRKIAAENGYEIKLLPYTGFPAKILGDREKMTESYRIALSQSREMLSDVDFTAYDEFLFIGKSIGTAVAAQIAAEIPRPVRLLLYTPLEAIYAYLNKERSIAGVACGTDDKHIEIKALRAACKKLSLPLVEIKNTGHRLEGGSDVIKDIGAIGQVIASIGTPQTAEKLWKEEKAEADKIAAEEKAAKEKAAKEKQLSTFDVLLYKEWGLISDLTLADDGTCVFNFYGDLYQGTWKMESKTEASIELVVQNEGKPQKESYDLVMKDGLLWMTVQDMPVVFQKRELPKESEEG